MTQSYILLQIKTRQMIGVKNMRKMINLEQIYLVLRSHTIIWRGVLQDSTVVCIGHDKLWDMQTNVD